MYITSIDSFTCDINFYYLEALIKVVNQLDTHKEEIKIIEYETQEVVLYAINGEILHCRQIYPTISITAENTTLRYDTHDMREALRIKSILNKEFGVSSITIKE